MQKLNFMPMGYLNLASLIFVILLSTASKGHTAAFLNGETSGMGCTATLDGPIVVGDVERAMEALRATQPENNPFGQIQNQRRLCLNSEGGSFEEGLRLATWLSSQYIATAVAKGSRCESACAIAFMGGRSDTGTDAGVFPNRILHPLGKLGFHAPSLDVPRGRYNEGSVTQAYGTALKSIEAILRVSEEISIPRSLVVAMMATPPTEMRYIDNVGEASRWEIAIAPVIQRKSLTNADIWRACNNADGQLLDQYPATSRNGGDELIPQRSGHHWFAELMHGFRQEALTGCRLVFTNFESKKRYFDWGGWVVINDAVPLWAYRFYLPQTPILEIALKDDQVMEFGPQPEVTKTLQFSGTCFFLRNTTMIDSDPCTMTRNLTYFENFNLEGIDTYTWPSGAQTIVTHSTGLAPQINGNLAQYTWEDPDSERALAAIAELIQDETREESSIDCYRNSQSGNHFCFAVDPKSPQSAFFLEVY